jgi:lipoprotein-anchoring transpeptidase ErfK/SrfK
VDAATHARLAGSAHRRPAVVAYTTTAADVRGPFRRVPSDYYAKARLDCLCYESAIERLAERFHTTPATLRTLNPEVDWSALRAGTSLVVPNSWRVLPTQPLARLVVEGSAGGLRGETADGALLFWLPTSLGSSAHPSPNASRLRVRSVTRRPWYHYDPRVLSGRSGRRADLPPGPNSPVGDVWIQLSRAHLGIHGTPEPSTIGVASSHGCVRLTNWDARWLADLAQPGVEVVFQS